MTAKATRIIRSLEPTNGTIATETVAAAWYHIVESFR